MPHARSRKRRQSNVRVLLLPVFTVFVCVQYFQHKLSLETMVRFYPRARREFRRYFRTDWVHLLEFARRQTRYEIQGSNLNVYVISLKRLRERSHKTIRSLQEQNVTWEFHDAIDGLTALDTNWIKKYAGSKKRKRLKVTEALDSVTLLHMKKIHDESSELEPRLKQSLHERLRFGCFMSHISLWQKMLKIGLPYAIIFEDDITIAADFKHEVQLRLERLPSEWHLLFLNGCFQLEGPLFDAGLQQARGGLCTFAYVISARGAQYLLNDAVLRSEKPIDHVLDEEILSGHLLAFHAQPALAQKLASMQSTLAY